MESMRVIHTNTHTHKLRKRGEKGNERNKAEGFLLHDIRGCG